MWNKIDEKSVYMCGYGSANYNVADLCLPKLTCVQIPKDLATLYSISFELPISNLMMMKSTSEI